MFNFAQRGSSRGGVPGGSRGSNNYRGTGGARRGRGYRGGYRGQTVWPPPDADRPGDRVITEGLSPSALETLTVPTVDPKASSFSGALQENVEVRLVVDIVARVS